jgi:hypothetical protein
MLNKKGVSAFDLAGKTIYWTIAVVILTAIIFAYMGILATYSHNLISTPEDLKAEMIIQRFTSSCFVYQDPHTERFYPNTIDMTKFTQDEMNKCYSTDKKEGFKEINFKLKLDGEELISNKFYQRRDFTIKKLVNIRKNNKITQSVLTIDVQEKI